MFFDFFATGAAPRVRCRAAHTSPVSTFRLTSARAAEGQRRGYVADGKGRKNQEPVKRWLADGQVGGNRDRNSHGMNSDTPLSRRSLLTGAASLAAAPA